MKTKPRCPACKIPLSISIDECYCGWQSEKSGGYPNHQCVFTYSGLQCPYDGANCQSIYGSGPWYCLEHFRNLKNRQRCIEILFEAYENFESRMEERIDWRAVLIQEEYAAKKILINELSQQVMIDRRSLNEKK
ncbi:MAG TPA: hypothetical protein VFF04_03620 [Candidatus Babeliales bacterium]|nr:hypothetical protein [Candidatus Babeliales bacterium]